MASPSPSFSSEFTVERISDPLGAEVIGIDTAQPLTPHTVARLREAFDEHHLLLFRDQVLDSNQQVAFSSQFGELEVFPEKDKTKDAPKIYHVANTSTEGKLLGARHTQSIYQKVNARWHTDSSYRSIPSLASIMYGVQVLDDEVQGGETGFANMFMAYDALEPEMKARIEPLYMVHYYEFGRRLYPELPPVSQHEKEMVPPVTHPLVRVHPDRDYRRSLFMTTNAGNEIGGMSLEQGQALHRALAAHLSQDRFCYYHRWRKGDLVMWDNRCLLHRAVEYDMDAHKRILRRTTVAGSGPILGPFSNEVRAALSG